MTQVIGIFICPEKGQLMREVREVNAIKDTGLEGDRYATRRGTYSNRPNMSDKTKCIRHVTIISKRDVDEANEGLKTQFTLAETRRNIVVDSDIDLQSLIGIRFAIGGVMFLGFEECTPCKVPSNMAKKPGFEQAFIKKGGLRAQILTSGLIWVGAYLVIE